MPGSEEHPRKFRFGPYELDEAARELRKNGLSIHLQDQPWEILRAMLERPGEVVSREDLRRRLWPDGTFVDYEQSLNKAVNKLREVLCDSADKPRYVETVVRRGYRFVAPVENDGTAEPAAQTVEPAPPAAPPRRRTLTWLAAGGCVLAVVLVTGLWPIDVPQVEKVVPLTNDTTYKVDALISDGNKVLFSDRWHVWSVPVSGGEPKRLALSFLRKPEWMVLRGYSPLRQQVLMTAGEELWLVGMEGEAPRKIGDLKSGDGEVALAPDAKRLAVVKSDGIFIQSLASGERKRIHPLQGTWTPLWWHPSGHMLGCLVPSDDQMHSYRAWQVNDDGTHLRRIIPEDEHIQGPGAWSQDGRRFFYGGEEDEVFLRIRAGILGWLRKAVVARLTASGQFRGVPIIDPVNPRRLYAVGTVQRGQTMRYDRQAQRWVPFLGAFSGEMIDFSPDGQSMVFVPFPGSELHKCGIDGSGDILLTPGVAVTNPQWSPDGKRIAFLGHRAETLGNNKLWLVSSAGGDAAPYRPEIDPGSDAIWSNDGKRLLLGVGGPPGSPDKGLRILHLETGKLEPIPGSEGSWSPRWSPDEKQIFAVDSVTDHSRIFDTVKGAWRLLYAEAVGYQKWSRDGKYIYAMTAARSFVETFRIEVATGRREEIARADFDTVSGFSYWLGWTQDMEPLTIRDLSSMQIYRIDLDR